MASYLNIIITSENVREDDRDYLFPRDEDITYLSLDQTSMPDLLVQLGAFPSRGQAKKNWKGPQEIPGGWSHFFVGKLRRELCIWNPTE